MTARKKTEEEPRPRRILRLREVERMAGLKRSAIYQGAADGSFPSPVPLSERAVGWLEDELVAWMNRRIAERDEKRRTVSETT